MGEVQQLDGNVAADEGQGQERCQTGLPAWLPHSYAPTRKRRRRVEIGDGYEGTHTMFSRPTEKHQDERRWLKDGYRP
jgi:hypothetical protein